LDGRIFFFFQAEDGIRDFHVTGVQTYALPISPELWRGHTRAPVQCLHGAFPAAPWRGVRDRDVRPWSPSGAARQERRRQSSRRRSEERRVGIWCRISILAPRI